MIILQNNLFKLFISVKFYVLMLWREYEMNQTIFVPTFHIIFLWNFSQALFELILSRKQIQIPKLKWDLVLISLQRWFYLCWRNFDRVLSDKNLETASSKRNLADKGLLRFHF